MVLQLEKNSPASPLVGIWRCTAKAAHEDFIRAASEQGMSVTDMAAQLGRSISEIVGQLYKDAP
jgi:hypothetical protein